MIGKIRRGGYVCVAWQCDQSLAASKKGAITILLLDGQAIADLLVERGLGVRKLPLYLFDIDEEFFDLEDE